MRRVSVALGIGIINLVLLAYVAVKTLHVDSKIDLVVRPARLFHPNSIEAAFEPRPDWEVRMSPDLDRFFYVVSQQTLYWLGRGMQAVVFETQDQKYVVKFFQLSRLREPGSRGFFRDLFSKETSDKREARLHHREEIFSSSKMCFEELQDETGIVYVHLNRTQDKIRGIKLVDKYGQSHRIRGDDTSFLVQKKAVYVIPTLVALMEQNKIDAARARIDQIFSLLLSLANKGFVDGDDALIRNNNIGFTEDRAIYIDTGHLFRAQNLNVAERMQYEFKVRLDPLERWLNIAYPELGAYYRQRKAQLTSELQSPKPLNIARAA
jgi:hypothetical protein